MYKSFGMTISNSKKYLMHVGKTRKQIESSLYGNWLEQVSEFKYLWQMEICHWQIQQII